MKTHSEFIKLIQTAFFIFFISCSYVYSQKNDKWTYDPDNPEKIQDMGYYGISKKNFTTRHPSRDRELKINEGDVFPFLGFSAGMAWFMLEDKKFKALKNNFIYKSKTASLDQKYEETIDKSYRFLSDSERHSMLLFLREKNVIKSIRDAEKVWSDDRLLETYIATKKFDIID
jgi:hypothetical protein